VSVTARLLVLVLAALIAGLTTLVAVGGSVPAWTVVAAAVVVLAAGAWWNWKQSGELRAAGEQLERYSVYSGHLAQALDSLQEVVVGSLPNATFDEFIDRGVLASAREVLLGFHADVRMSVLVPDGERWTMRYQAGHNLASQKRYAELIDDTLAGGVLRGGEALHVPDVTEHHGFRPNPQATRPFRCMSSVPIKEGGAAIAVLNVISGDRAAFDRVEERYIESLAAVIAVAMSMQATDQH
jgi:GAF domain-containing protein